MATIGSAVGIANIWRFSSIAGQSGGGTFLIPFFLAVVLFAFPLMLLEMGCGRRAHADVLTGFRQVAERFRVVGWFISLVIFALTAVYLVITGWTLAYLVFSLIGEMVTFGSFSMTMIPLGTFLVS
ncbi:MAG: sodium-dependent transporter, partial [Methanomassiliicoccales archaeon]